MTKMVPKFLERIKRRGSGYPCQRKSKSVYSSISHLSSLSHSLRPPRGLPPCRGQSLAALSASALSYLHQISLYPQGFSLSLPPGDSLSFSPFLSSSNHSGLSPSLQLSLAAFCLCLCLSPPPSHPRSLFSYSHLSLPYYIIPVIVWTFGTPA